MLKGPQVRFGGEWHTKKMCKNISPLIKQNISTKTQEKDEKLKGTYRLTIGIGMIENSRYIGTSLSGLIQEINCKKKTLFNFFKEILY